MPKYQATDSKTGQTFEFDWYEAQPPTDADLEQVFASMGDTQQSAEAPGFLEKFGNQLHENVIETPSRMIGGAVDWVKEHPAGAGAMAAGIAAAPFTAGASLPAVMALEGLAAGGGAVLGQTAKEASDGFQPGAMGRIATEGLTEGAIGGALPGAGAIVGSGLKKAGTALYRRALSPAFAVAQTPEAVDALVQTGLDSGINVSAGGLRKLQTIKEPLNANVDKIIKSLNGSVDMNQALQKADQAYAFMKSRGAEPSALSAVENLRNHYAEVFQSSLQPEAAQTFKQGLYGVYDRATPAAVTDMKKAVASDVKGQLEGLATAQGRPELGGLNSQIGSLIDLEGAIKPRLAGQGAGDVAADVAMHAVSPALGAGMSIAKTAGFRSGLGRGMVAAGKAIDPRSYRTLAPMATHAPQAPVAPPPPRPPAQGDMGDALNTYIRNARFEELADVNSGQVWADAAQGAGDQFPARTFPQRPEPFDPRTLRPADLDDIGVPVTSHEPYAPNSLDAVDIPIGRGVVDEGELWQRKLKPYLDAKHEAERVAEWRSTQIPTSRATGEILTIEDLRRLGMAPSEQPAMATAHIVSQPAGLLGPAPHITPLSADPSGVRSIRAAVADVDAAGQPIYSSDPSLLAPDAPLTKATTGTPLTKAQAKVQGYLTKHRQQR